MRFLYKKRREDQRSSISIFSALYEPLQYPLFYFHGSSGWNLEMKCTAQPTRKISQIDYYRHLVLSQQERGCRSNRFQLLGRLYNEWLLDMWSRTEDQRLDWIRHNQPKIVKRCDMIDVADVDGIPEGMRGRALGHIFLPGSFPGSRRYQLRLLNDALAIVARRGKPSLFITFTCNPNWPEILAELEPGQTASDRPDVVCTVFHEYLALFLKELRSRLGTKEYLIDVIEFQKAGLPHAHICIRLAEQHRFTNIDEIDRLVSAMVPDEKDKELHTLVMQFMIHQCSAKCVVNGNCKKGYPKELVERTYIDNRGACITDGTTNLIGALFVLVFVIEKSAGVACLLVRWENVTFNGSGVDEIPWLGLLERKSQII